jgi:hypothetical protein
MDIREDRDEPHRGAPVLRIGEGQKMSNIVRGYRGLQLYLGISKSEARRQIEAGNLPEPF